MSREKTDGGGSTEDDDLCGLCRKKCKSDEKAMSCDGCNVWYHISCVKIPAAMNE